MNPMRRATDGSAKPEPDDEAGPEDAGRHGQGSGGAEERGRRGQRRRRHGHGEDQRRARAEGPPDRPGGGGPRGRRHAPGHGPGRGERGDPLGPGAGRVEDERSRWRPGGPGRPGRFGHPRALSASRARANDGTEGELSAFSVYMTENPDSTTPSSLP